MRQASFIYDKALLPNYSGELQIIKDDNVTYIVDIYSHQATDGKHLIDYSDTKSIKELTLFPGNKLRIDWGKYPVDCDISDLMLVGKVVATYLVNE